MAEKKKHLIKVQDQLVPVNEEVYLTYYRMKRREIYLEERDTANGVFYYSALDAEGTNGEDVIPDRSSPPVEDLVMDKLITEKLHRCLAQLAKEEQELIFTLFFQNFFIPFFSEFNTMTRCEIFYIATLLKSKRIVK